MKKFVKSKISGGSAKNVLKSHQQIGSPSSDITLDQQQVLYNDRKNVNSNSDFFRFEQDRIFRQNQLLQQSVENLLQDNDYLRQTIDNIKTQKEALLTQIDSDHLKIGADLRSQICKLEKTLAFEKEQQRITVEKYCNELERLKKEKLLLHEETVALTALKSEQAVEIEQLKIHVKFLESKCSSRVSPRELEWKFATSEGIFKDLKVG